MLPANKLWQPFFVVDWEGFTPVALTTEYGISKAVVDCTLSGTLGFQGFDHSRCCRLVVHVVDEVTIGYYGIGLIGKGLLGDVHPFEDVRNG